MEILDFTVTKLSLHLYLNCAFSLLRDPVDELLKSLTLFYRIIYSCKSVLRHFMNFGQKSLLDSI